MESLYYLFLQFVDRNGELHIDTFHTTRTKIAEHLEQIRQHNPIAIMLFRLEHISRPPVTVYTLDEGFLPKVTW